MLIRTKSLIAVVTSLQMHVMIVTQVAVAIVWVSYYSGLAKWRLVFSVCVFRSFSSNDTVGTPTQMFQLLTELSVSSGSAVVEY